MTVRIAFGFSAVLFSAVILAVAGCDKPPAPPAVANSSDAAAPADDHGHEHGHDEHAHDHDEEHAGQHQHEHDHADGEHAHPETYAAAIAELDELRAAVEKASGDDDLAKADGEVHEIGHILEEVGKLADKESIGDDAKTEIKSAVEDLMDAFEQIDAKIHGDEGKTYADVAEKINAAMSVLKANAHEEK
jgi:hypothetical protein